MWLTCRCAAVALAWSTVAGPVQGLDVGLAEPIQGLRLDVGLALAPQADPDLAGYLGAFFLGSDPFVYFYLSNGNNPVSFKALNRGSPVMKPTKGTGGVRDPAIVRGGGAEAGRKWYIVGTDLDIGKVSRL